jgi:nucleoside-diphosphate-sugar epimerase
MLRTNLGSTVNLLSSLASTNCRRIVIAGSMEEPADREATFRPGSPYAVAKVASTLYARFFHDLYQSPIIHARIFMVYGPGQSDLKKLIPYVALSFLRGEAPRLTSGNRPVDWVFVTDVADALVRMLGAASAEGRSLDIGSGRNVTIRDVVSMLEAITKTDVKPIYGALQDRPMENCRPADVEQTLEVLGWAARTQLAEGLMKTVGWYRELA